MSPELAFAIETVLEAAFVTVLVTVSSGALGVIVAIIGGSARISPYRSVRIVAGVYVEFFRGTSVLVQMFWLFFVLPMVGITLPAWLAGTIALSLNFGAYGSEIVRGAIESIPQGQWDAATALGLGGFRRMRLVVLPQALPIILPSLVNNLVDLLKACSLLSLITVSDLTQAGQILIETRMVTIAGGYALILVCYFILALPVVELGRRTERWFGRHLTEREQTA
jgi:polar amino acid transport system permease protein